MPVTAFSKLKLAADARPLVDQVLARAANAADRAKIETALVQAAGADGNKVLSAKEVRAIVDAFQAAAPGAAALTPEKLGIGLETATATVKSMESLSNLDGVTNAFTLQGASLETKLIADLQASVARAAGRPMDVNVLIFEFQSDAIEKALTDIAKNHPNVTVRVIADSGQASETGGNALPSLLKQKLPNVQVKFKKDFPYVWSSSQGRPVYNHGATQGLNHHKGLVTFIDGKPDTLVTGSFNWSSTADTKNYEDLTTFNNMDSASARAIAQFGEEFAGYWNNPDAALSPNAFQNFKGQKWNELLQANGKRPTATTNRPDDSYAEYALPTDSKSIDVNSVRAGDEARLGALLGSKTLARTIRLERQNYGRFADLSDLKERVPQLASFTDAQLVSLGFGSGKVSINTATLDELDAAGLTKKQAEAVVAWREKNGDFDSVADLKRAGVPQATINKLGDILTAIDVEAFFNSRPYGAPAGDTGYGPAGNRQSPVAGADGTVKAADASVTVAATDLFNRAKPPQTIDVAMYGMSPSAPEVKSLMEAAKRGVPVRVILNDDFTATSVAALKALATQGYPVEVRIQKAKTMHEKFGVVGDDVFSGSANFSESSSTKHSENRITIKNHAETADAFRARFEEIWSKSKTT